MNSMTGFGRGDASNGATTVVVELKAVNNRFLDVVARLPREYAAFEVRVANLVRTAIQRGRVETSIRRSCIEGATRIVADVRLAEQYRLAMIDVAKRIQHDPADIPLALIAAQPGVLVATDNDADAMGEWELVEAAVNAALIDLATMRGAEGRVLAQDLSRHLDDLLRLRAEVEGASEGVAERLRLRLTDRVQKLVAGHVDPARIASEAAILADKADISEELARLGSHCEQFTEALNAAEPVGRKLDFLLQEMNREVNTIGSKAAELPISTRVVEMKTTLERMREQAANVE